MTELRGQEAWTLSLLQAWGQHEEARHYLEQLNKVQIAFGREPYSMPAAASVGLPDLVKCDAAKVSDVLGEQVERELRFTQELGDAARAARAGRASHGAAARLHHPATIAIARKSA